MKSSLSKEKNLQCPFCDSIQMRNNIAIRYQLKGNILFFWGAGTMTAVAIVDNVTSVCWVLGHDAHFLFDEKTLQQCVFTVLKGICSFLMWTCVEVIWGLCNGAELLLITRMTRYLLNHTTFLQLFRKMHWDVPNYMHRFLSSGSHLSSQSFRQFLFKFNIIQDCQIQECEKAPLSSF